MSMTDPIADMLTRIRNANFIGKNSVTVPHSKLKEQILKVLISEGYIEGYLVEKIAESASEMKINLKYGLHGEKIIREIRRVSKPGRRVYYQVKEIRPVLRGTGIGVYSTSKGILTDTQCRKQHLGGELICTIW